MSDLPARTVKKLLVFSLLGFVIFSAMNSVALIMYTNNNADQLEQGLFDACERGNVIRYLLADDNEETCIPAFVGIARAPTAAAAALPMRDASVRSPQIADFSFSPVAR